MDRLAASRPGRPGKTAAELALEDAQAEIVGLRETVIEQAIELHLFRGRDSGAECRPGPNQGGRQVKAGLLDLIDHAVDGGWSGRRACRVLEVHPDRTGRWRRRRDTGATPESPLDPGRFNASWQSCRPRTLRDV